MRRALHELLHVGDAGERIGDHGFFLGRQTGSARDLLNVIAISLGRWDAARRGVRLLEKARVGEVSHHVADGCGAESFAVRARESAGTDGLARGNEGLHDGRQDFAFAIPDIGVSWHTQLSKILNPGGGRRGKKRLPIHST